MKPDMGGKPWSNYTLTDAQKKAINRRLLNASKNRVKKFGLDDNVYAQGTGTKELGTYKGKVKGNTGNATLYGPDKRVKRA